MDAPPVQYVKTSDGYNIACTARGEGQSLLLFPILFSSVQTIWRHYPELMGGLADRFRMVSFDARGEGLSGRGLAKDMVLADFDRDAEAVMDVLGHEPVILFALGSRGHQAIRYASAHPDRVRAIVWNGASIRNDAWPESTWIGLSSENWRLFLEGLAPRDIPREEQRRRIQDYGACIDAEDWSIRARVIRPSDISKELQSLTTPILVTHPRDYLGLPVEESMKLVAATPNARLVVLDGDTAIADAEGLLEAVDSFLKDLPSANLGTESATAPSGLSERELEVLRLLAQGKSNQQIADELVISLNTVRRHVSNVFDKTGVANRAQAAVYAKEHGIV
jgi:DNA-binding CsgD family transcriptional regulator/pimeloyl-ACP methyl ester carboxylesterase